jgi:hypothetical protein
MRNPISLSEMYRVVVKGVKRQPFGHLGRLRAGGARGSFPTCPTRSLLPFLLLIVIVRLGVPGPAAAQCPPLETADRHGSHPAASPAFACRFDAALTRMFTPREVPRGTYRVYVTETGFENVAGAFKTMAPAPDARGAWTARAMDPLDAFGEAGLYDRAKVARLYVGLRARVAHGPIIEGGRTVASITLVSPYPDASLTRLESGTLIIEFRIPREIAR